MSMQFFADADVEFVAIVPVLYSDMELYLEPRTDMYGPFEVVVVLVHVAQSHFHPISQQKYSSTASHTSIAMTQSQTQSLMRMKMRETVGNN
jgi:hypothetical protein